MIRGPILIKHTSSGTMFSVLNRLVINATSVLKRHVASQERMMLAQPITLEACAQQLSTACIGAMTDFRPATPSAQAWKQSRVLHGVFR